MADDVDLALKTGNSENMNNPVNETRLKEMYEELRKHWPKFKLHLQRAYRNHEEVSGLIQVQCAVQRGEIRLCYIIYSYKIIILVTLIFTAMVSKTGRRNGE